MQFEESEEQSLITGMVERFLADKVTPALAGQEPLAPEHWRELADLGLLQWLMPERGGGMGGESDKVIPVAMSLGQHLCVTPVVESILGVGHLIAEAGSDEQIARWLGNVVDGTGHIAWASAGRGGAITAREQGGGWCLNGNVRFARWGDVAGHMMVLAHDAGLILPFVIPADQLPEDPPARRLADMSFARQMRLANLMLPADSLVEASDAQIGKAIDRMKLGRAAQLIGVAARIFEDTRLYAQQRKQFSVSIGSFQAVQHHLARMFVSYEQGLSALYRAGLTGLGEEDGPSRMDEALSYIAERALHVAQTGVQIFGGMGITDELPVGRAHRQVLVLAQLPSPLRAEAGLR